MNACICVCMVEKNEKHSKIMKKVPFKMKKKVCWPAFGSDFQNLVDTEKLVAHLKCCCFLFFFLHAPLICMTQNVLWKFSSWPLYEPLMYMMKKLLFYDFWMFSFVFDHANVWASMLSLVKIHNTLMQNPFVITKGSVPEWRFCGRDNLLILQFKMLLGEQREVFGTRIMSKTDLQ